MTQADSVHSTPPANASANKNPLEKAAPPAGATSTPGGAEMIIDCEADEHDGREPSLGWTIGGSIGGTSDNEITSPEVL